MFGVPCGECGLPMEGLWLFKVGGLEVWHYGTDKRCYMPYVVPHIITDADIPEKRDGRRLPRSYGRCHHCGVRFNRPYGEVLTGEAYDLCKSCRNQQGLFSDDEITELKNSIPGHPE